MLLKGELFSFLLLCLPAIRPRLFEVVRVISISTKCASSSQSHVYFIRIRNTVNESLVCVYSANVSLI